MNAEPRAPIGRTMMAAVVFAASLWLMRSED